MYSAVMKVEGAEASDSEIDYYKSIQKMINAGSWSLQGSFGRTMMRAIEDGRCMLGRSRARDYYGNTIPARDDVERGTKGSASFVTKKMGANWSRMMARVK